MQQVSIDHLYAIQEVMHSTGTLCVITDASARSMDDMGSWLYTDKDEMKHLGGALIQMTEKLREFLLLGISKMVEDFFNNINEVQGTTISVWDPSLDHLSHVREVRWVRHLSNVIKHNNSVISSVTNSRSCRALIQQFGAPDDTPVAYLPEFGRLPLREVMLRYTYYAMTFCFALLDQAKLFSLRNQPVPHDDIPDYMLDRFVRRLPGHPERVTNG